MTLVRRFNLSVQSALGTRRVKAAGVNGVKTGGFGGLWGQAGIRD